MPLAEVKQVLRIQGINHCLAHRAQVNRSDARRKVMAAVAESVQALTPDGAYHGALGPRIGGLRQEIVRTDWNFMMCVIGYLRSGSTERNYQKRTVPGVTADTTITGRRFVISPAT
jgi:hypothetical protein